MQENSDKDSAMKALRYDYGHQVNGVSNATAYTLSQIAYFLIWVSLSLS